MNNRINVNHRIANTAVYQENKAEDNSYENDHTNVEKIERYIEVSEDENHEKKFALYIEGPGTEDEEGDATTGYAIGKGGTGISAKVEKGISKSIARISKQVDEDSIIDQLTLDVFGFSRGAAGARSYIFEALQEYDSIREGMEAEGMPVKKIEVDFAGLFDTVASHGLFRLLFSLSNTKNLKLHAVSKAKQAIHSAAHRSLHCSYRQRLKRNRLAA